MEYKFQTRTMSTFRVQSVTGDVLTVTSVNLPDAVQRVIDGIYKRYPYDVEKRLQVLRNSIGFQLIAFHTAAGAPGVGVDA